MSASAERTSLLYQGMTALGYSEELLISDFRRAPGRAADVVDLVGFGLEEPKDTSTAVVVADSVQQVGDKHLVNLFDAATDLAAPVALASDYESLRIFATATGEVVVSRPLEHVSDLREYRATLGPRSLLEAKRGARQIGLFPVPADALENARRSQRAALGAVIAELLRDLGAGSRLLQLPAIPHFVDRQRLAYRAVGSALCAMVLADKTGYRGSTEQILSTARQNVASLFDWFDDESDPAHDMLLQSVEELSANIDFRKFDTNVLSRVYEEVLVDPDHRRELGIHYTPPAIAENLLRNLPIEIIPPDDRYVLDPACGSGTLLVAAHDRLSNLQPAYWDTFKRHDYLRSRLRGRDRDPLAVELTRLALVLHAIPAGNGWEIEQGDSLDETRLRAGITNEQIKPTIAVANPPFELPVNAGARLDIAVRFLDIILRQLAPNGLFGVILPASWLSGTGLTRDSREQVESTCEIFELWRLPRDTFSMSRASTVVLLGRKLHEKTARRRSGLVQRVTRIENLEGFFLGLDSGSQRSIGSPFSRSGPVTSGLSKTSRYVPISSVATTRTGAQPLPGHLEQAQAGLLADDGVKWLPQLGRLPQFSTVPDEALLATSWPAGFLRNIRARDVFSPKFFSGRKPPRRRRGSAC